MKIKREKYVIELDWDERHRAVGELTDSFIHSNSRMMYVIRFNDGVEKGYYHEELKPLFKLIKS